MNQLNLTKIYVSLSELYFPVRIDLSTFFFFASNNYHDTVDARAVSLRPIQRRFKAISLPVACPHHFHSTHSWLAGNSEEWTAWWKQWQLHFGLGSVCWCCLSAGYSVAAKWIRNNQTDTSIYFREVSLHIFGMCWELTGTFPVLRTSESFSVVRLTLLSVLVTGFGFPRDWCYAAHRHQNNFDVFQETCVMCEWCGSSSLPLRRKFTDM